MQNIAYLISLFFVALCSFLRVGTLSANDSDKKFFFNRFQHFYNSFLIIEPFIILDRLWMCAALRPSVLR